MILGIRQGDSGAYVELVQLALIRSGAFVELDGIFGTRTLAALVSFQRRNSLEESGTVDTPTAAALLPYLKGYRRILVQNGDSLYALARQYDTTVSAIRVANPRVNPLLLEVNTALIVPLGFELVSTNVHYTHYYVSLLTEGLALRFPFTKTDTIGKTVLNKDIFRISIGAGEQKVLYNAAHHANEWITTPLLLKFFEAYAKACAFGEKIYGISASELFSKTSLTLIPMVDADGVDLVNGALTGQGFERAQAIAAAFPSVPFPAGWKANIDGVDLNLNYPAQWQRAKEIKFAQGYDRPAPRDYVGSTPLCAPESIAMAELTRAGDYQLTLSYHTQGQVIYWKFDDYLPPRGEELGRMFAEASGYALATTPYASDAAGYKDWFIQTYNRPGYTVEVGIGENPISLAQFDEIYKNNLGILTLGMYLL